MVIEFHTARRASALREATINPLSRNTVGVRVDPAPVKRWVFIGDPVLDRRTLELNRRRIERSQLLETNPQIAEPPDIKVVPRKEDY